MLYLVQHICFARICFNVSDFANRNLILTIKAINTVNFVKIFF